ncbi:unnamed protein product [Owenia fusiformis]|uniref:Small ribosomal subunit protein bS16m n=1 Tax=Owenia fusiformis TaxID=6347 RepID=A0A8S4PWR7_OWEFU|nr:unnamed protein product [Owenia fusiformis]
MAGAGRRLAIRFALHGCANRPFYHVVVMPVRTDRQAEPIEQLGTYDPYPNKQNEKLVSFNFERLRYWIGQGAEPSKPVAELLGLSGFLPIHPRSYIKAQRRRKWKQEADQSQQENNKDGDIDTAEN